jgi:hypothetical protein
MAAALCRASNATAAAATTGIWGGSTAWAAASSSAIAADCDDAPGRRGEVLIGGRRRGVFDGLDDDGEAGQGGRGVARLKNRGVSEVQCRGA